MAGCLLAWGPAADGSWFRRGDRKVELPAKHEMEQQVEQNVTVTGKVRVDRDDAGELKGLGIDTGDGFYHLALTDVSRPLAEHSGKRFVVNGTTTERKGKTWMKVLAYKPDRPDSAP